MRDGTRPSEGLTIPERWLERLLLAVSCLAPLAAAGIARLAGTGWPVALAFGGFTLLAVLLSWQAPTPRDKAADIGRGIVVTVVIGLITAWIQHDADERAARVQEAEDARAARVQLRADRRAAKENLSRTLSSQVVLRGIDLRGQDLSGAYLAGKDLRGADLREATLVGATLPGAKLRGALLFGADLSGAVFSADLRDASLEGAGLNRAEVGGVRWPEGFDLEAQQARTLHRKAPPPLPPRARRDEVERVEDGDTLVLRDLRNVRLIGIDAPQAERGARECHGEAATEAARRLLPKGREIIYQLGDPDRDVYGRSLAYLWLHDRRFVNEVMVELGDATPLTTPPNDRWAERFRAAAVRAQATGRGLWAACPPS
jgi:micrococcal nuclease